MPFNQFAGVKVTGSWEDHASYSAGGTDYPLAYGTAIMAPARGTLYTSGRPPGVNASNEWACGWVGTAGRRSILMLETAIPRPVTVARRDSPPEGTGSMVAIVFQHQSAFAAHSGSNLIYGENQGPIGWSGASANGDDHGGDVHLHWHGLNASGQRLRVESFLSPSQSTAGDGSTPIENKPLQGDKMTTYARRASDGLIIAVPEGGKVYNFGTIEEYDLWRTSIVPTLNGERAANGSPLLVRPPRATGPEGTDKIVSLSDQAINTLILASGAHS